MVSILKGLGLVLILVLKVTWRTKRAPSFYTVRTNGVQGT